MVAKLVFQALHLKSRIARAVWEPPRDQETRRAVAVFLARTVRVRQREERVTVWCRCEPFVTRQRERIAAASAVRVQWLGHGGVGTHVGPALVYSPINDTLSVG